MTTNARKESGILILHSARFCSGFLPAAASHPSSSGHSAARERKRAMERQVIFPLYCSPLLQVFPVINCLSENEGRSNAAPRLSILSDLH